MSHDNFQRGEAGGTSELASLASNINLDAEGNELTESDTRFIRLKRIRSTILPFLIFRYPETRPYHSDLIFDRNSVVNKTRRSIRGLRALEMLVGRSVRFLSLLVGVLIVGFFMVYVCFSFNGNESFPTVGSELDWVLVFRNIILIACMHHLCLGILHPNRDRLRMLLFDMESVDKDLSYVGVVHTFRKFGAWWTGRVFKIRWFTTFLSDSILLGFTYIFYAIYLIFMIADDPTVARILSEITNIYRGSLTCGFIIYMLEFAPRYSSHKKHVFTGLILLTMAMQISDFFLFIKDKKGQSPTQRFFGSIGQLFVTHSSVLLGAILGGHYKEAHLTPDLPWKGVFKLSVVFVLGGVWSAYAVLREQFGYNLDGEYMSNWIPVSFPYVYWSLQVGGGLACLALTVRYLKIYEKGSVAHLEKPMDEVEENSSDSQQQSPQYVPQVAKLVTLRESSATWDEVGENSHAKNSGDAKNNEDSLDFDVQLIVLTFSVASVYFSAQTYAFFVEDFWITGIYYITSPIGFVGLSVLVATVWWKPPVRPLALLYFAMLLACCFLASVETFEDCHLNSPVPKCCEYPWLPDSNLEFEHPHDAPSCSGIQTTDGVCLIVLNTQGGSAGSPSTSSSLSNLFLLFNALEDTTRGIVITGTYNGTQILYDSISDPSSYVQTTSCRSSDIEQLVNGTVTTYKPGCSGEYLYNVPVEIADLCDPSVSLADPKIQCIFTVQTLNCAFAISPALVMTPVYFTSSVSELSQLLDSLDLQSFQLPKEVDHVESEFYTFFQIVGLGALLECSFTLFGVIMKLVFLSECRTIDSFGNEALSKRRKSVGLGRGGAKVILELPTEHGKKQSLELPSVPEDQELPVGGVIE